MCVCVRQTQQTFVALFLRMGFISRFGLTSQDQSLNRVRVCVCVCLCVRVVSCARVLVQIRVVLIVFLCTCNVCTCVLVCDCSVCVCTSLRCACVFVRYACTHGVVVVDEHGVDDAIVLPWRLDSHVISHVVELHVLGRRDVSLT